MDGLSVPLQKWIDEGVVFKFWGDNVDKQLKVRDLRSDHKGEMVHMFSLLAGRSRTPAPELSHSGGGGLLTLDIDFLPSVSCQAAVM